jgi:uncharacterized protein (DUF488 family)
MWIYRMNVEILTIGHSTQSADEFIKRLRKNSVSAVADVRSTPYSRHNPQFNREELKAELQRAGVQYVFLGKELGARSGDECCYVDDKVQYPLLAKTDEFQSGLTRVLEGAAKYKIALMCAERDPIECHRTILVGRELIKRGCSVQHILIDGTLESHADTLCRLVKVLNLEQSEDLFRSNATTIDDAYDRQASRIAYDRGARRRGTVFTEAPRGSGDK